MQGKEGEGMSTGGYSQGTGDGDGGNAATHNTQGYGYGADAARRQRAWDWDGADRATALPLADNGAERGGNGGSVGGRRRRTAEITRGTVAPVTMVTAVSQPGRGGLTENPGGGSSPMGFLGLTDLNQLAGIETAPQGVACPTNGENWGRRLDDMINRTTKGGRTDFPTNGKENGRGTDGVGGVCACEPPKTTFLRQWPLRSVD